MKVSADGKIPAYIKYFYIVGSVTLTCFLLTITNFIVNPLLTAAIVAILLTPLTSKLERFRIPKIISTTISVTLFLVGILILIAFVTAQFNFITNEAVFSVDSLTKVINDSQNSFSSYIGVTIEKLRFNSDFVKGIALYFPGAIVGTANYLTMFILFFTSLFFFLYYRSFLILFIYKLFAQKKHHQLHVTLDKISDAIKKYIVGLFIVISIVAFLNSIGLLFLGINHAIFFAVTAAILTIIPYVGIMIGALFAAFYAFISFDSLWYPIGVILIFGFVQFLEGNFITPIVIGSKVNINPFVAILGLFIGGMLLGAVGIILAIPILGIIKIIFDDSQKLKALGFVMGNPVKKRAN